CRRRRACSGSPATSPSRSRVRSARARGPRERDDLEGLLVLLVRDDLRVVLREERVVVEVEREARRRSLFRIHPQPPLGAADEDGAVVPPVGDQQVPGDRGRRLRSAARTGGEGGGNG